MTEHVQLPIPRDARIAHQARDLARSIDIRGGDDIELYLEDIDTVTPQFAEELARILSSPRVNVVRMRGRDARVGSKPVETLRTALKAKRLPISEIRP